MKNLETPTDLLEIGSQVIRQRKLVDIADEMDCSRAYIRLILNGERKFDPLNKEHWAIYALAKQIYSQYDAILEEIEAIAGA